MGKGMGGENRKNCLPQRLLHFPGNDPNGARQTWRELTVNYWGLGRRDGGARGGEEEGEGGGVIATSFLAG